ncbi:MAG: GMC family oxidoreductase [Gammaproteobacteria bacterium]|nr:GMC family oxidoreductase [Gammaproteobacteria bacterium]
MIKKFSQDDDSVVVVVGSGAGGATLSRELSNAGIDVLCLEAGSPVERIVTDAQEMFGRLTWFDRRIGSGDLIKDFPVWSGKNVGGTTMHWTASTPRIPRAEFRPSRYFGDLKHCSIIDWPIAYDDFQPWYHKAEQQMGVSNTHGRPPLPANNHYKLLEAGARRIGLKQAHIGNMAINSVAQGGRPACIQLGFCVSGCAINAKWTAANTPIAQAMGTGHFELRSESFVLRIEHDKKGRAAQVVYVDAAGKLQKQKARVVCVAANSIDTPRILLHSDSAQFPRGLANRAGHVGKHYMKHVFSVVTAIMPKPVNFHRGTQNMGIVDDFVKGDRKRGFAGGFKFEMVSFDPESLTKFVQPGSWGRDYTDILSKYDHFAALLVMGEDPSQSENHVSLHATEKDQYGMPVPVIHYRDHENSKTMRRFGQQQAKRLYESLGSERVFIGPSPPATHNMGTCRMATKAEDGVCDAHGRSFDVPNLFISDGSQFPSSGSSNPTLTIVALALRQADYIKNQMQSRKL